MFDAIVGLGNPGSRYSVTRHNIGFMFVDALYARYFFCPWKKLHCADISKILVKKKKLLLIKPMNYMNNSGNVILNIVKFYKLSMHRLLIVHDDLDLDFLKVDFRSYSNGRTRHNGVRSINRLFVSDSNLFKYGRLRIGISRPIFVDISSYVLSNFNIKELDIISSFMHLVALNLSKLFDNIALFVNLLNEFKKDF